MLVFQGDKNKDLDRTLLFARPGAAKRGGGKGGISHLREALPSAQKTQILLLPSPLLSSPGYSYVNCGNHVNLSQLFIAAVLSSLWIAITAAGAPCCSIVL